MKYRIVEHIQRNGYTFYTIQYKKSIVWRNVRTMGFSVHGVLGRIVEFATEELANMWIEKQSQIKQQEMQKKHDSEVIRSRLIIPNSKINS